MDYAQVDIIRIVLLTVASMALLYLFKRRITRVVTDLVVGSDTSEYQDASVSDLRDRIEAHMDEVLR